MTFAADGAVTVEDAARANGAASAAEKLYPVHAAKWGGVAMRLLMTASGLSLFMLGGFATYAFWLRRALKRRKPTLRSAVAGPLAAEQH